MLSYDDSVLSQIMVRMQDFSELWNMSLFSRGDNLFVSVGDIISIVLLVLGGYLISKLIEYILARRLNRTKLRADTVDVIKRITFYSIFVLIALTILGLLGIPITAFAFATGAIAVGIGFGAQNIINNFISGWILMAERPIRSGDFIDVDNFQGTVKRIGTRSTLVHRLDGVHVLVPNSKLLENTVVNWTLIDGLIRSVVRVGVAYGTNPDKVMEALKRAVDSCADALEDPEPEIVFEDFGDSALIFDVYFWCDVNQSAPLRIVRSEVRLAISRELNEASIVVAFPQRDVHLHAAQPIAVSLDNQDS